MKTRKAAIAAPLLLAAGQALGAGWTDAGFEGRTQEVLRALEDPQSKFQPSITQGGFAADHKSGILDWLDRALTHWIAEAKPSVVQIRLIDQSSSGSGFIADAGGIVVTNQHVVAPVEIGAEVDIHLPDGNKIKGQVKAKNQRLDLAIIQLPGNKSWPALKLGASRAAADGQLVMALGHPVGLPFSSSLGILSGTERRIEGPLVKFLQTDAAINPGNSGGPLLDKTGAVIGVNTIIMTESGGFEGLAFSIPSEAVARSLAQYRARGHIRPGWLGITLSTGPAGATVREIGRGSPAAAAGFKIGDVLRAVDGETVSRADEGVMDAVILLATRYEGDVVSIEFGRNGRIMTRRVPLAPFPEALLKKKEAETEER